MQQSNGWQFWIDRGGTFTDIVARDGHGQLHQRKLLSDNPSHYADAALHGIRQLLQLPADAPLRDQPIATVKMGTTVATNALLERKGDATALLITRGYKDALKIGYQNRPELFALNIQRPAQLYRRVVEVEQRIDSGGNILVPLALEQLRPPLQALLDEGILSVAIVLMHAYRYPQHELEVAALAAQMGFCQISVSHQVSPLIKLISRGDTTVVDAYLTPMLRRYTDNIRDALGHCPLQFMQSSGGLTQAGKFQGKDAILSGPAGGVVGMVETARRAGFHRIIGFDMGGTSTDVSLFNGEYQRSFDTEVAGVRMRAPMMKIHTVAAGGGSILDYDGARFTVGPNSAGAYPGPLSYRNDGPLTVTDVNLLLGRIQAEFFPALFGAKGDQPLDTHAVQRAFQRLAKQVSQSSAQPITPEQVGAGFLRIAVNHMANAIKKISTQQGHDVTDYTLACFGGAGAQHACLVAAQLGIQSVFIHPLSGVLSAYGMGLASVRHLQQSTVEAAIDSFDDAQLNALVAEQSAQAHAKLVSQNIPTSQIKCRASINLRYQGADTSLPIPFAPLARMAEVFHHHHLQQFGFCQETALVISSVQVEAVEQKTETPDAPITAATESYSALPTPMTVRPVFIQDQWQAVPFYRRAALPAGSQLSGPAILLDDSTTVVVEADWRLVVQPTGGLVLQQQKTTDIERVTSGEHADPVMLELFNSLFMHIAEQMGTTLQQTASSVNIKERLDFSCAVFDHRGELVANAPHMPIHLGSMSESVRSVLSQNSDSLRPGDSIMLNSPYHGGTHLPDITVVTPLFDDSGQQIRFLVASRGHHADIGGITPGSMPAHSTEISEEGILFENFRLVRNGRFAAEELLTKLTEGRYPARAPHQNIADLKAQLAANQHGINELQRMLSHFGHSTVAAYMQHILDYAEQCVRKAIGQLHDGHHACQMDNGATVRVTITVNRQQGEACIDFSGSTTQLSGNFNAPQAITKAVVLYVFRSLVDAPIPLNAGCLKPLNLIIPEGSMLAPHWPAAVVAGNVETSQCIADALLAALGKQAGSQGTMNNLTFGNGLLQYYETLCGGTGAGEDFHGSDAVHSHMTNSRLTDPEVLESRYPVRLESFAIRQGSGGKGRFNGGNGVIRQLRFLQPMSVSLLSNHRHFAPQGLAGGDAGACGVNSLLTSQGEQRALPGCCQLSLGEGDLLTIATPGGGGFGEPAPEKTAADSRVHHEEH